MIGIALFVVLGAALFLVFLRFALQGPAKTAPDSSAVLAVRQMANLQGLSFLNGTRLLDGAEFEMLRADAKLRGAAKQLRKDRQALALLWTSLLLDDVNTLWRFRRSLVRSGAPATASEEFAILRAAVLAVVFLHTLRMSVYLLGPFAFTGAARRARRHVEQMSYASALVLDKLPRAGWPEFERTWQNTPA